VDQLLLQVPLDLDLVRAGRLRLGVEGCPEALGDEPLADAGDGARAGAQSGDDVVVGVLAPGQGVGQQQDACMGQFAGGSLADGDQAFQFDPFLRRQGNSILVHRGTPLLETQAFA
jgi:hypothetical protein